jgi:hypothetical protein
MDASTPIDHPSLRLPRPFVSALLAHGISTLGAAWANEDADLLALHGVGPKGIRMLREVQGRPRSDNPARATTAD